MPFKDTIEHPDPVQGWSPGRTKSFGASILNPIVDTIPSLDGWLWLAPMSIEAIIFLCPTVSGLHDVASTCTGKILNKRCCQHVYLRTDIEDITIGNYCSCLTAVLPAVLLPLCRVSQLPWNWFNRDTVTVSWYVAIISCKAQHGTSLFFCSACAMDLTYTYTDVSDTILFKHLHSLPVGDQQSSNNPAVQGKSIICAVQAENQRTHVNCNRHQWSAQLSNSRGTDLVRAFSHMFKTESEGVRALCSIAACRLGHDLHWLHSFASCSSAGEDQRRCSLHQHSPCYHAMHNI